MIRKAVNGHIPPAIADDSFHHADVGLLGCERAPLLNMQLKVGKNVAGFAAYAGQATGIAPNERNPVAKRLAAARRLIQVFFAQLTRDRPTPLQTTFLIL